MLSEYNACWNRAGLKLPVPSLKTGSFMIASRSAASLMPSLSDSRMHVDRSAADQPRQHQAIKSESARLLQAEAPPGLPAHLPQHVLLRTHVFLRSDLHVADGDDVLRAVALEPSRGKPNDEARNQNENEPDADDASRTFAQTFECHALNLPFAICQSRAGVRC